MHFYSFVYNSDHFPILHWGFWYAHYFFILQNTSLKNMRSPEVKIGGQKIASFKARYFDLILQSMTNKKLEYWQNFVKKTSKLLKLFINIVKKFFIANGRISKGQNLKALYYLWIKYIFCYISLFLNVKNHLGGASSSAKFKMRRWVFQMSPPSTSRNFYYHLEFYWLEK